MREIAPVLYIFSGLPGTGKTTLAQKLSTSLRAVYLRIDTIEQTLRELYNSPVEGEGYQLAYQIAADNLQRRVNVIADSCNPIELTRTLWMGVATTAGVDYLNIEVICSDPDEHRHRVESRAVTVPGLVLPTWEKVVNREYSPWSSGRLVVDTAHQSIDESFALLQLKIEKHNE